MIIYADTSTLVKLFVIEESSEATRATLLRAQLLGTGLLTRAEIGSAFSRALRGGLLSPQEADAVREKLDVVWPTWIHVTVDEPLVALAEELAWAYGLRGYDTVHLACAKVWQEQMGQPITLATFDRELWEAAKAAGLEVWPP